jgi:hypothetical protein
MEVHLGTKHKASTSLGVIVAHCKSSILQLGVERQQQPCKGDEETPSLVEKLYSEDGIKVTGGRKW